MNQQALRSKCGTADITLGQVRARYGKRLIIIVTELDSGRERRLTPESDPDLPLRVAVRMSMGVPGIMEPFRYQGHVYCDGGMTNDFPIGVLPEGGRIGLMVRPKEWVAYNMGWSLEQRAAVEPGAVGLAQAAREAARLARRAAEHRGGRAEGGRRGARPSIQPARTHAHPSFRSRSIRQREPRVGTDRSCGIGRRRHDDRRSAADPDAGRIGR